MTPASGSDITQVRPFTLQSDVSDAGEDSVDDGDSSSLLSFHTQPAEEDNSYMSIARQSGATRKTG